jgi:hypothetical protein
MITWFTIFIVVFVILSPIIIADDPCKFTHPDKGTIDLTTLGKTDGTPAYLDKIPPTGSNYSTFNLFQGLTRKYFFVVEFSYNPCRPFSEGVDCQDVAACQG